jgi:hypothetical protein
MLPVQARVVGHKRGGAPIGSVPELQYDYEDRAAERRLASATAGKKRKRGGGDKADFTKPSGGLQITAVPEKPDYQVLAVNNKLGIPLPRLHFIMQVIAPRGSGKTTLLINFLTRFYRGIFDAVFVISPTMKNDSKWDEVPLNQERVYTSPNIDTINKVLAEVQGMPKRQLKLIVFDDCIGKESKKFGSFFEFTFRHRHSKTSIITCSQSYKMTDKMVRSNTTHYVIFPIWNESEVRDIAEELCMDWRHLAALMPAEQFSFLFVDRQNNAIYKNLEEYLGPLRAPPEEMQRHLLGGRGDAADSDGSARGGMGSSSSSDELDWSSDDDRRRKKKQKQRKKKKKMA